MTVQDLIEKLQTLNPDAIVKVWRAFDDCETSNVVVSVTDSGDVFILEIVIGEEV